MTGYTKSTKPVSAKNTTREWHLVDMKGKVLGREMPRISTLLQGKHKTTYSNHLDEGDYVVVINAANLVVTGAKAENKEYSYYSGFPGGQKVVPMKTLLQKKPGEIIRHAVSGMLPKNKLRADRLARLFVYAGDKHPYESKIKK